MTHREFPVVHVMRVDALMLFVFGGDGTVKGHHFPQNKSERGMVRGAECAMYLYMVLNHLTKLSNAALLDLPFVITEGEVHFGEMLTQ